MSTRREHVLQVCAARPGAEQGYPFGDRSAVFTVGGRMFAVVGLDGEPGRLTVKCEPGLAAALVTEHVAVVPGYHMDKRHWITLTLDDTVPADLVDDLVSGSHELVVDGLPGRLRPAGPRGRWTARPASTGGRPGRPAPADGTGRARSTAP